MGLVYCTSSQHTSSLKEVSTKILQLLEVELRFLYTALTLDVIYHFIQLQQNPLNRIEVMHSTIQQ